MYYEKPRFLHKYSNDLQVVYAQFLLATRLI